MKSNAPTSLANVVGDFSRRGAASADSLTLQGAVHSPHHARSSFQMPPKIVDTILKRHPASHYPSTRFWAISTPGNYIGERFPTISTPSPHTSNTFGRFPTPSPHIRETARTFPRAFPHIRETSGDLPRARPHIRETSGNLPRSLPHTRGTFGNLPGAFLHTAGRSKDVPNTIPGIRNYYGNAYLVILDINKRPLFPDKPVSHRNTCFPSDTSPQRSIFPATLSQKHGFPTVKTRSFGTGERPFSTQHPNVPHASPDERRSGVFPQSAIHNPISLDAL